MEFLFKFLNWEIFREEKSDNLGKLKLKKKMVSRDEKKSKQIKQTKKIMNNWKKAKTKNGLF